MEPELTKRGIYTVEVSGKSLQGLEVGTLSDSAGNSFWIPALIGLAGAVGGAIVSTRLIQNLIKNDLLKKHRKRKNSAKKRSTTMSPLSHAGQFPCTL